ncbi:MAG: hypothetical protein ACODAG_06650 [Myxococcota bacterium]
MTSERRVLLLAALLLSSSCGGGTLQRFPLQEPMWVDPDERAFTPKPEVYYSPFAWDAANQTIFRPLSRFFAVDPGGEATNVNAFDEVPSSSWFHNRAGMRALALDEFVNAACGDEPPLDPAEPWTVTDAKADGANPGFVVDDPHGRRYLLKFDGTRQPERSSSADVIGSILYWAAGYHVPCNRIVYFSPEQLRIGANAMAKKNGGGEAPLERSHIDEVLQKAVRDSDGRYRGMASRYVSGEPLGPWKYQGTRDDDPNDVVPHEDRRDLRGAYVLASWINHFDSREQNTLAMWITSDDGSGGHVRHNLVDFGDSLGSMWQWDVISRRLGHSYYLDVPYMLEDLLTLGLMERPWHEARLGPTGETLGYYDVRRFEPDAWRPGYPNPAFSRMTERDAAWMARIVAQIPEGHVVAAVREAMIQDPIVRRELTRVLLGRREAILERWLRKLSPLTHPKVVSTDAGAELCLRDLAVHADLWPWERRPYRARAWVHERRRDRLEPVSLGTQVRRPPEWICVGLPEVTEADRERAAYLVVDVTGLYGADDEQSRPARVHLYQLGPRRHVVVGLERPYESGPPG